MGQRSNSGLSVPSYAWDRFTRIWQQTLNLTTQLVSPIPATASVSASAAQGTCDAADAVPNVESCSVGTVHQSTQACCVEGDGCSTQAPTAATQCGAPSPARPESFPQRLAKETWSATLMVIQFMLIAFVLEAIIIRYVPATWITGLLGQDNPYAILLAAAIGVPVYTSNLTALPMIGGLLEQGMSPAAGLAFLIAGPTTTLPAMAAVWQLTTRRVFALYVALALIGAIAFGYSYQIVQFAIGLI